MAVPIQPYNILTNGNKILMQKDLQTIFLNQIRILLRVTCLNLGRQYGYCMPGPLAKLIMQLFQVK